LPFIDLEGTRSGDVARRAGISKQAAAKGIKELEDAGLLTRSVDAQDARAARVQFTERGIQYLLDMHDAISRIEASYEAQVGTAAMEGLRSTLQALIAFETQKE
jgi:DNA-binding MarR family transcriptional regulator